LGGGSSQEEGREMPAGSVRDRAIETDRARSMTNQLLAAMLS
jgi:hypothetical protein